MSASPRSSPVDMVFTYVDGRDPAHVDKRARLLRALPPEEGGFDGDPEKPVATLFSGLGEITFSVRSVLKHLPWVRTVYVVTDAQLPPVDPALLDCGRVRVIDHSEIVPREYLPTFNSLAIESCLHRIPGLSEVFLYDNDDFLHFAPVPEEALCRVGAGGSISITLHADRAIVRRLRHLWRDAFPTARRRANAHTVAISNAYAALRRRCPRLGWYDILAPQHVTQVIRRSTALRLEQELAAELAACRTPRFRSRRRLSYGTLLYTMERQWHEEDVVEGSLLLGRGRSSRRVFPFHEFARAGASRALWDEVLRSEVRFACLNDMEPFEYDSFVDAMRHKDLGEPILAPGKGKHGRICQ